MDLKNQTNLGVPEHNKQDAKEPSRSWRFHQKDYHSNAKIVSYLLNLITLYCLYAGLAD